MNVSELHRLIRQLAEKLRYSETTSTSVTQLIHLKGNQFFTTNNYSSKAIQSTHRSSLNEPEYLMSHLTTNMRTIIHLDINSCFASCEQQDHPDWRGKPLGVVQDSGKRSVIISSSIEAKMMGVATGCPIWEAKRLCPSIILTPARFARYAHYSRLFRQICHHYSDQVEVFSIDELFIDITDTHHLFGGPIHIAYELKYRLRIEVGDWLRVSIGIAPNKMLAKLASGSQKPDGLVVVDPKKRLEFLDIHPLWHICGIGSRIEARLHRLGIYTIKQLRQAPVAALEREFGVLGRVYWQWGWGEDYDPVAKAGEVPPDKSYGNQMTLPADTKSESETKTILLWLCWQVAARLRSHGASARVVWLGLRHADSWAGAQKATPSATTAYDLYRTTCYIYQQKLKWDGPIRFAAVGAGHLTSSKNITLPLDPWEQKQAQIATAWDKISDRYGVFTLRPASLTGKNLKQAILNGFSKKF